MKRSFNPSAAQIALLSILGGLIFACGLLVPYPIFHHKDGWTTLTQFTICIGLIVLGSLIAIRANSALSDGIRDDRWHPDTVEHLRAQLESRWSQAFAITLALGYAFFIFRDSMPHHSAIAWSLYILIMNTIWLRGAVRRRGTPNHQPTWSNLAPLRSEHWGNHS